MSTPENIDQQVETIIKEHGPVSRTHIHRKLIDSRFFAQTIDKYTIRRDEMLINRSLQRLRKKKKIQLHKGSTWIVNGSLVRCPTCNGAGHVATSPQV